MNFSSLREYFYKLNNRCFVSVLLPLFVFIFLYFELQSKKILPLLQGEFIIRVAMVGLCAVALINLTTVHWLSLKRLRVYATEKGLGNKLDRYAEVISFRFGAGCASSLVLAIGAIATGSELFGLVFLLLLLWMAFQWPTSGKACRALRLKGDEYQMVFYKKDKF
jgi:hypothetical protein